MTTDTAALSSMALALAGAKKTCDGPLHSSPAKSRAICELCAELIDGVLVETGEVYVLGSEVRVRCDEQQHNFLSSQRKGAACWRCDDRGWEPLDPMLLGRWQVALAEVINDVSSISFYPPFTEKELWTVAIKGLTGIGTTPEEAFFQAATLVLGVDVV